MDIVVKQAKDVATVSPQRIEELVDRFIASQDVKESSKLLYRRTLKQYFNWVDKKGYLLSEIARPQLLEYKDELLLSGMSSLTVGSYITSVRRFYEWTEANIIYPNVAKGIKTPKRKQQFKKQPLLPAQATALLSYYQDKALRDYAIVMPPILRKDIIQSPCKSSGRGNVHTTLLQGSRRYPSLSSRMRSVRNR